MESEQETPVFLEVPCRYLLQDSPGRGPLGTRPLIHQLNLPAAERVKSDSQSSSACERTSCKPSAEWAGEVRETEKEKKKEKRRRRSQYEIQI